jgi:hypothetical protein
MVLIYGQDYDLPICKYIYYAGLKINDQRIKRSIYNYNTEEK